MQHQLTMAKEHAFRQPCGAGGVEGGGAGVFVEIREVVVVGTGGQQGFVFALAADCSRVERFAIVQQKDSFNRLHLVANAFDHRQKFAVDQHHHAAGIVAGTEASA